MTIEREMAAATGYMQEPPRFSDQTFAMKREWWERRRLAIHALWREGMLQTEVGKLFGISQARAWQIITRVEREYQVWRKKNP